MSEITEKKTVPTYINVESEDAVLEFDLVTFRQKGEEERYLSISFSGIDITKDPPVPQTGFINVNEEGFKKIKDFFEQLEWRK